MQWAKAATSDIPIISAAPGYQPDTATVSGTVTVASQHVTIGAEDSANYTGETYSAALQKQIDINGTGWIDVSGTGPTVLAGATVAERVIATNTGSVVISDAAVSDSGTGPADFTFGGSGSTVIAVGGSVTSDVATVIASTGYQADTATLSGSVSDSYGDTGTVSATSGANFTGETYSATLQKQIDINGTGWIDVSGTGPTVRPVPPSPSASSPPTPVRSSSAMPRCPTAARVPPTSPSAVPAAPLSPSVVRHLRRRHRHRLHRLSGRHCHAERLGQRQLRRYRHRLRHQRRQLHRRDL